MQGDSVAFGANNLGLLQGDFGRLWVQEDERKQTWGCYYCGYFRKWLPCCPLPEHPGLSEMERTHVRSLATHGAQWTTAHGQTQPATYFCFIGPQPHPFIYLLSMHSAMAEL